ncbi:hypothetical protein O181_124490 [Austropuccinia psidii MF-1]|uniref:DUF4219 domain-containing protein n=1 Tax=Austropuccinia psidii MF-1 TaxID=1389203 RepID=A0A9Q3KN28_9BASI|nr:hypothetical protein [Austropuccinia psidii MF-1]
MTEKKSETKEINIPILDGTNFSQWHIHMKIHLRSKDLLDVCEKTLTEDTITTVRNKWNKASYEAISIITSSINEKVFLEVINPETTEHANLLWSKIKEQYASVCLVNRGSIWMDWERCFYNGNLQSYIDTCRKLLLELKSVSIKVPNALLSYSLLGKLAEDSKLHQFIESLTLNEELIEKPDLILTRLQDYVHHSLSKLPKSLPNSSVSALISSSNNNFKIIYYCTNGKYNLKNTSHRKDQCWAENPHLRTNQKENKKRKTDSSAHLSIVKALITMVDSPPKDQI